MYELATDHKIGRTDYEVEVFQFCQTTLLSRIVRLAANIWHLIHARIKILFTLLVHIAANAQNLAQSHHLRLTSGDGGLLEAAQSDQSGFQSTLL